MPRGSGSKIKVKKQNKNKKQKEYNCEDCLDTGKLNKGNEYYPCPYCK